MRQYRAIRNCMIYWFARIILEKGSTEAVALSCRIHVQDRLAINRLWKRRTYWRYRHAGLDAIQTRAKMEGNPEAEVREREKARKKAHRARWGGDPKYGTDAYNRWVVTK